MKKLGIVLLALVLSLGLVAYNRNSVSAAEANQLSGKVVVYSPHGEEIMSDVAEWFRAETGVRVEFIIGGGAELVERIRAEKNNPQADVIYGNPTNVFEQMKQEGLLATSNPSWADQLQEDFKDADGYYYGTIQTPVLLFYNSDKLTEELAPKDWSDLADPRFKNQIVIRSVTSAASRATISALISQYDQAGTLDPEGWDFMRAMDQNIKSHVTDSGIMFQTIAKGEAQVGFWTLDGITTNISRGMINLKAVVPASGAIIINDCVAVINGAKNQANAHAFLEFVGSKEVQVKLAEKWNRMPTLASAVAESPAWMTELPIKGMDVDWALLTDKQADWMQFYNDEIVGASRD